MAERINLYFIALIPQKDVYDAITDFKKDFAIRFASERALKMMPHITLKAPFKLPAAEHSNLLQWFQELSYEEPKFTIELKDFGSFSNRNPVVFVQPVMNTSLFALQKKNNQEF